MSKIDLSDTSNIGLAGPSPVPRDQFEAFLNGLIHEIRNRLSNITLEATLLSEMAEPPIDITKLQRHVKECSDYLKNIRETLAPDDGHTETVALSEFLQKIRERKKL